MKTLGLWFIFLLLCFISFNIVSAYIFVIIPKGEPIINNVVNFFNAPFGLVVANYIILALFLFAFLITFLVKSLIFFYEKYLD